MKHLKTKLMASVAMLMVATVMMSSASFAWFTISTAPEVSGVSTKVAANGNLEIALANDTSETAGTITYTVPAASTNADTGKNTTWGNLVDISNYFTAVEPTSTLKPVSYDSENDALKFPDFGEDGRVKQLTALAARSAKIAASGTTGNYKDGTIVLLKNTKTTGTGEAATTTVGSNWAYRIDYFMRTNTAGNILLATGTTDRGNGENGTGCSITSTADSKDFLKNIKVAFKVYDLGTPAAGAAATPTSTNQKVAWKIANPTWDSTSKTFTWATDAIFAAEADHVYLVETFLYWDGASLTNADMKLSSDVSVNVQFKHSAVGTANDSTNKPIALQ